MAKEGEIVLTEIRETEWGEEAVLDSEFEAKDFIKVLPWQEYSDEVAEYGSLREKANERDMGIGDAVLDAVDAYNDRDDGGFPDDFATHVSWDAEINKWTIDSDAFQEAQEFWEFAGFEVRVSSNVAHAV